MLGAILYGLGYTAGLACFLRAGARRGLTFNTLTALAAAALLGGLAGANLTQWFATGEQGKTVLGGLAAGYLAVVLVKRRLGLSAPTGMLFTPAFCLGEAIGRWGCLLNGCCYGRPTRVPWAIWQHHAWRHPTQIYLSLIALGLFASLQWSGRSGWQDEKRQFALFGFAHCGCRFGIEFFRDAPHQRLASPRRDWPA